MGNRRAADAAHAQPHRPASVALDRPLALCLASLLVPAARTHAHTQPSNSGGALRIANCRSELDGNRCAKPIRTRTTPRIGFRRASIGTARTCKAPEFAPSKITFRRFRAGRSRASQTPGALDAAGVLGRAHQGAAWRASPGSLGRWCVRQNPTICGLEAPGALRRTPHAAHAGKT